MSCSVSISASMLSGCARWRGRPHPPAPPPAALPLLQACWALSTALCRVGRARLPVGQLAGQGVALPLGLVCRLDEGAPGAGIRPGGGGRRRGAVVAAGVQRSPQLRCAASAACWLAWVLLLQLGLFPAPGRARFGAVAARRRPGQRQGRQAAGSGQGLPFGGAAVGALLRRRAALLQLAEFELQLLQALGAGLAVGLVPGTLQAGVGQLIGLRQVVSNAPACWGSCAARP